MPPPALASGASGVGLGHALAIGFGLGLVGDAWPASDRRSFTSSASGTLSAMSDATFLRGACVASRPAAPMTAFAFSRFLPEDGLGPSANQVGPAGWRHRVYPVFPLCARPAARQMPPARRLRHPPHRHLGHPAHRRQGVVRRTLSPAARPVRGPARCPSALLAGASMARLRAVAATQALASSENPSGAIASGRSLRSAISVAGRRPPCPRRNRPPTRARDRARA